MGYKTTTRNSSNTRVNCGLGNSSKIRTIRRVETIHARIASLRKGKGLSMQGLAKLVGVSYQTVQQWENGKSAPKRTRLERVASVLGVSPQELVAGVSAARKIASSHDSRLDEIPALFAWLTDDQKEGLITKLRATALANKAIAKELGGKFLPVHDIRVAKTYKIPPFKNKR
jgi:transcriptional regulator with XRE-family HTH domain